MSEQLGDAAKPWLDRLGGLPNRNELEFIYSIVGAIWNVSCLPEAERAAMLTRIEDSVRPALPDVPSDDVAALVREIHARASRLCREDRRYVAKVSVMEMSDGMCHVVVASMGAD